MVEAAVSAPLGGDGPAPWHALEASEVERRLQTDAHGLSAKEAAARLARFGANQLEDEPPAPALVVLLRQFRSPLIYILVAATGVTLFLAAYIDAGVIAFVLAINAGIGFTQERKAEGAVRALMQLMVPRARVVRDGQEWEIDSRELVPGDVVLLEPGARVPADLRLVWANALQVNESLLTGESLPPTKRPAPVSEAAPLADRRSMAYTGTVVSSGRGRGVVVATGAATELGAIAKLIRSETAIETPLQRRMARLSKVIGVAVGACRRSRWPRGSRSAAAPGTCSSPRWPSPSPPSRRASPSSSPSRSRSGCGARLLQLRRRTPRAARRRRARARLPRAGDARRLCVLSRQSHRSGRVTRPAGTALS